MKLRSLLVALALPFFISTAHAQADRKTADRLYDELAFAEATEIYKKLLDKKEPNLEMVQRIAHGYRLMNNSKEAEFWYAQVLTFPGAASLNLYFLAEAARRNGNYAKAKQLYLQYGSQIKTEAVRSKQLADACDLAVQWAENPKPIELKKEAFNSENSDFSPVFFQNGLVITSDRPAKEKNAETELYAWNGKPYLQLYTLTKDNSKNWGAPVPMPETLNNQYHNATATFSKDGNTVFFTRTNKERYKKSKINTDPTSWASYENKSKMVSRLEIFISDFKNGTWSAPRPFQYNKPREYSVGHPALSADGQVLYFASDMPGSLGETDIFYSLKQRDGSWGKPVNCGPQINTTRKECFPTLTAEGVLHFSSDGHLGMGGLDLFSAEGSKETWKRVTNLQAPLNSGNDDFGIIFEANGEEGFLSSNRQSDNGTDNIYSFKPYRVPCNLEGIVVEQGVAKADSKPGKPLSGVKIKLYHPRDTTAQVAVSNAEGKFSFPIEAGIKYTIKGIKEGYLTKSADITPDCKSVVDMIKMQMTLHKNVVNNSYIVENIYYDLDKSEIRPDAALELNKLVVMLKDNPKVKIELSSHTDSRQGNSYNQMLSQLRAESAVKYIISQGIEPERIKAKGYGETRLLNRCGNNVKCTEEEHQRNRRTEFKILR